jgi:hypothetical protein
LIGRLSGIQICFLGQAALWASLAALPERYL